MIVKRQPFANLSGRIANDGIQIRVIVRRATEDINSYRALLERIAVAKQSLFDDIPQEGRVALAVGEIRALQNLFERAQNLGMVFRRDRNPSLSFWWD